MSGLDEQDVHNLFCPICGTNELFFQSPDGTSRIIIKEKRISVTNYNGMPEVNIRNLLDYTKNKGWVWGCRNSRQCGSISARREETIEMWSKLRDAFRRKYG